MKNLNRKINLFLPQSELEDGVYEQIEKMAVLPFVKHVAILGDCHIGKGGCVGSVVATEGAIIPACLGVDISCGMIAVRTKFIAEQLPDDLKKLREGIERRIPLGAGGCNNKLSSSAMVRLEKLSRIPHYSDLDRFHKRWENQLGSLGSGNHFIEVCLDETNQVWVTLHSGSRGIGNQIAQYHIKIAKKLMDEWFIELPDKDLAYLMDKSQEFKNYITDVLWAQEYALLNREEMMDRVMTELSYTFYKEGGHEKEIETERININHNFSQLENHFGRNLWITRKGAIQMRTGTKGLIPGSMSTASYVVEGKGNIPSMCSAPHGAGRNFSRTEARRRFNMEDFEREMKGIECRHDEALIDELPGAYKPIDKIMEYSKDLVEIKHILKQVVNIKGN